MNIYSFMDSQLLLLAVIAVLLFIILGAFLTLRKKNKVYDQMFEDFQNEAVASLSKVEKDLQQEKEELVNKVKEGYENKISDFKEYVRTVEKISRTKSEVNTHNILTDIKQKFVEEGTINPSQMTILDNVYIPHKNNADGEILTTKIDHIVMMKTGIYIIDTNEFQGDLLYGVTRKNTKQFSFILDHLFPSEKDDAEKTIVFTANNNDSQGLNVTSFDNPSEQVITGAIILNQLLEKYQFNSIKPILYFHVNKLMNFSQNKTPFVFSDKLTLFKFFKDQVEGYNVVYSEEELNDIKNIIEDVSIINSI